MRLAIVRGGGIAGLVRRTELSADALAPADAESFAQHVRRSGLADLSEPTPPAPGERRPDELLYAITFAEPGRERTLRFTDEQLPDAVRELIAWVDGRPERTETISPPGR